MSFLKMNKRLRSRGLPLTIWNSQFRSGAAYVTEFCEGMTWLCLLSSADAKARNIGTGSMELVGQSLDHWRGVIWNPGIAEQLPGSLRRLIMPCDVDCLHAEMNQQFKGVQGNVKVGMTDRVENNRLQWCAGGCRSSLVHCPAG